MDNDFQLAGLTLTGREYNLESAFDFYALIKANILWEYLISLGYDEESVLGMASGIINVWARLRHSLGDWRLGESGTISVILECLLDTDQLSKRDADIDRFVLIVVTALFCFDRAVASNSRNRAITAAKWLERADELYYYSSRSHNLTEKHIHREIASKGGNAKNARYEPLKQLAKKLVEAKKFKSKRNAVKTITPEIILESKKLGIALSEHQAEITITGWLTDMGLPANI